MDWVVDQEERKVIVCVCVCVIVVVIVIVWLAG